LSIKNQRRLQHSPEQTCSLGTALGGYGSSRDRKDNMRLKNGSSRDRKDNMRLKNGSSRDRKDNMRLKNGSSRDRKDNMRLKKLPRHWCGTHKLD
jgi:hypothetical protein